jgi:hypothetical protein
MVRSLVGERAQLVRDDEDVLGGPAGNQFARTRQRHRARRAAELGDGHPLGALIETHGGDEVRVEGRNHHAGARGGDDEVDVAHAQPGVGQCTLRRLHAERLRGVDEAPVALPKARRHHGLLDGLHEVALLDARVVDDAQHARQVRVPGEDAARGVLEGLAREFVRGHGEGRFAHDGVGGHWHHYDGGSGPVHIGKRAIDVRA